jgi:hypothetical protein
VLTFVKDVIFTTIYGLNNEYYVNKLVADAVEKAFKSEK